MQVADKTARQAFSNIAVGCASGSCIRVVDLLNEPPKGNALCTATYRRSQGIEISSLLLRELIGA